MRTRAFQLAILLLDLVVGAVAITAGNYIRFGPEILFSPNAFWVQFTGATVTPRNIVAAVKDTLIYYRDYGGPLFDQVGKQHGNSSPLMDMKCVQLEHCTIHGPLVTGRREVCGTNLE